ncbi:MAG: LTA synthase family protein [Lachnospiraceae bacterium]|nr:LTA synthase family protein [Lachnospiraceae bacterium]
MKRFFSTIFYIVTGILVFLVSLIGFASRWAFSSWGDLDMDEIVFHLQEPLKGASSGIVWDYLLKGLLPVVVILVVYVILLILLKKRKRRLLCACAFLLVTIVFAFFVKKSIWDRLDMKNWIDGRLHQSNFIEENYVDPTNVKLSFPEKKKNLIYIYLESMETTYADEASGGAFSVNVIPELTSIAQDNEDFSGSQNNLNGGVVFSGTGFTTGAMFAQTTGLPLKISIGSNFMDTQNSFFPQVTALGDILKEAGYRQVFLLGSDATFGGRRLYYQDHGDFEIRDYLYAKEEGWIDPDYEVWWGYEDQKLFSFAKETLLELAEGGEPFHLTILTVDTHYEDGYVCDLCDDEFGDDQYANVMACSSRQTAAFLEWLQQQDFYKDTVVILCGDHTTMDTNFCADVDGSYQRKFYTAFVNTAVAPEQPEQERAFSSMDLFPTTLAAIGVTIDGNRLALGTNLFSSTETLLEQYGQDRMKKELLRKSDFLESLEKVDENVTDALYERYCVVFEDSLSIDSYNSKKGTVNVRVSNIYFMDTLVDESLAIDVERVEVEYQEDGMDQIHSITLKPDPKDSASYIGTVDISSWSSLQGELRLNIYTADGFVFTGIDSERVEY